MQAFGFQTKDHDSTPALQRDRKLDSINTNGTDKSLIFSIWLRIRSSFSMDENARMQW